MRASLPGMAAILGISCADHPPPKGPDQADTGLQPAGLDGKSGLLRLQARWSAPPRHPENPGAVLVKRQRQILVRVAALTDVALASASSARRFSSARLSSTS